MMVTAEAAPYAKVGGLGDVAGTLPLKLGEIGIRTSVFMPFYREVALRGYKPGSTGVTFHVDQGGSERRCEVLHIETDGTSFYFLDEPELFNREWIYGPPGGEFPDSAVRYSFLCKASLMAAEAMGLRPHVIHCHDWHAALVPLYMKYGGLSDHWKDIPKLLTIHNLAYQGLFGSQVFPSLGLPLEIMSGGELEYWERINFLKGGILASDIVSTVSPTYAEEIRSTEQGQGLDRILSDIGARLKGILNGLDYEAWDPMTDEALVAPFSSDDPAARRLNLEALREQLRLYPKDDAPVFAFIGRLVHQKGVDILSRLIGKMVEEGMQLVVLGSGDFKLEESLLAAGRFHQGMVSITIGFNDTLARRIYASSDFFLMPSRFEPCGLGQMISMRYGSLPVVRMTGGLKDTVFDIDEDPLQGNGFLFEDADEVSLWTTIRRADRFYRGGKIPGVLGRIMSEDFSWRRSARLYADLYKEMTSG
jgi:starch synthase